MDKRVSITWTKKLLYDYRIIADEQALKLLVQKYIDKNIETSWEIEHSYPIIKIFGGVSIEIGEMVIKETTVEYILSLFTSFITISDKANLTILQNIEQVETWAEKFYAEIPHKESCEGYIFNNELVNFYQDEKIMILQFKYKDHPKNSFVLYKLSFFHADNRYFISQGKYF
ncbi:MAG: hypothetical protein ACRC0X_02945 [Brevinema sp.]